MSEAVATIRLNPADLRALAVLMDRLNDHEVCIAYDDQERPTAGVTLASATVLLDRDRWAHIELAGGSWWLTGVADHAPPRDAASGRGSDDA